MCKVGILERLVSAQLERKITGNLTGRVAGVVGERVDKTLRVRI